MRRQVSARGMLIGVLAGFAILIAVLHVVSLTFNIHFPGAETGKLLMWFDLDGERNVPTVYSGLLLGCSAFMALLLSSQINTLWEKLRWVFLAVLFFYLAFDEILGIHETFAEPIREMLSITEGNPLFHAWIIPGMVIMLGIASVAALIKRRNKISQLQKSVFLYVVILAGGVILLEIIGTQVYFTTAIYKLGPVFLEEMFEITMTSFILYKLTMAEFKLSGR